MEKQTRTITEKEVKYAKEMLEIIKEHGGDPEMAHGLADDLLVKVIREELGYHFLIDLYEAVEKWYA